MKMHVRLTIISLAMVCVNCIGASTLGGNSPASSSDPEVQKARSMVENEIKTTYPGATISNFNAQKQVVNGIRYNITFTLIYTPSGGQKTQKECKASLVSPAGSQNLQFVSGPQKVSC